MGDFGKKFREAREKKDLSYDDVSNVTKISSRMLQAIEDEHFDLLPGGVFNKGFIRAYAKHLGLDPEEAVTDYLACLRQAQVDAQEVWEPAPVAPVKTTVASKPAPPKPPSEPPSKPAAPVQVHELPDLQLPRAEDVRPPRRDFSSQSVAAIPWRIVAATAVVITLAALLWIRHSRASNAQPASANAKPATTQSAVLPPTPQPAVTQASAATAPAKNSPPSNSPPSPAPASSQASASIAPSSPKATPTSPASETKNTGDVTVRTFGAPVTKRADKTATSLSLVIRANETSWISVVADGQVVTQETLIAPAHTSVRAAHQIDVRIGNAAGISFIFNGKEFPADGNESEVKSFTFNESGMKFVPTP